jgi:hypothetical protein
MTSDWRHDGRGPRGSRCGAQTMSARCCSTRAWTRCVANVWDIIALQHRRDRRAQERRDVSRQSRVSADIRVNGLERLNPADVSSVLAAWPREGFTDAFAQILIHEVLTNLSSTRLSWLESVAVRSVPGFTATDLLNVLHASSGFPSHSSAK